MEHAEKNTRITLQDEHLSILAIIVLHAGALTGILSPWVDRFVLLTPFHLCFSVLLVLKRNDENGNRLYSSLLQIAFVSFFIEIIGVNSNWIYGKFAFGASFGPKILGTPAMIGIVWALFTLTACQATGLVVKNKWVGATIAAVLITALNWIMEPIAPKLGFWHWNETSHEAGLHDYIGCFIQGWLFSYYLFGRIKNIGNLVGLSFLLTQAIFFVLLRNMI